MVPRKGRVFHRCRRGLASPFPADVTGRQQEGGDVNDPGSAQNTTTCPLADSLTQFYLAARPGNLDQQLEKEERGGRSHLILHAASDSQPEVAGEWEGGDMSDGKDERLDASSWFTPGQEPFNVRPDRFGIPLAGGGLAHA